MIYKSKVQDLLVAACMGHVGGGGGGGGGGHLYLYTNLGNSLHNIEVYLKERNIYTPGHMENVYQIGSAEQEHVVPM